MLLHYIYQSLGYINAAPLQTVYSLDNMPSSWEAPVLTGGIIFACLSEAILQTGESFSYSDNLWKKHGENCKY